MLRQSGPLESFHCKFLNALHETIFLALAKIVEKVLLNRFAKFGFRFIVALHNIQEYNHHVICINCEVKIFHF